MKCPDCEKEVEFGHFHNGVHGIAETHMTGTERYVCPKCGKSYYKSQGEKLGFKYKLD